MKAHWLLLFAAVVGCGGSVDNDQNGNPGGGGTGAIGGDGGASASGGTGALGGSGGSGGSCEDYGCDEGFCCPDPGGNWSCQANECKKPPFCCESDQDCPTLSGEDLKGMSCIKGQCKMPPPDGQCWQDSQCDFGMCVGASVCECGNDLVDCDSETLGWCASPPPPSNCCTVDMDCGDEQYVPCVNGACKQPVAGQCWNDAECPVGQTCIDASVCPCNCPTCGACGLPDQPGKCG